MDIAEFAEKFMKVNLRDWQKKHIRALYEISRDNDVRIVMNRHAGVYIYMKAKKGLTQHG